ncbi:MAG: carboxypeptidase regulatory-like domain-containing protein [Acidobacteria bacterium]|jgi:hypothetical protein|nr:MAG: carboxypeptidase regulatory-like domain-containing protein [Acidobacteriota bacterium]GIU81846.1 MAG: hypothetical protein KatS3mg006_0910 [Pyrinomonadaceae bacterium]
MTFLRVMQKLQSGFQSNNICLSSLFSSRMKLYEIFQSIGAVLILCLSFSLGFSQGTGNVKGKVRTPEGKALADVTIVAKQKDNEVKSTKTNSKGEFILENLPAGRYNFTFTKTGYSVGILYNVEVREKKTTDLGDRLILTVDQGTLVIIKGSVFDQNGLSVPDAKVEIERIFSDGTTKKVGSAYTTETGEFTFRFPEEEAKFRVTATKDGVSASKEISVDAAAVYRLSLKLEIKRQ